jgi:hypothetical protein
MQRNITIQQWNVKPSDERFDLFIKDKLVKPSTPKTQQICQPKTFLMSLGLS